MLSLQHLLRGRSTGPLWHTDTHLLEPRCLLPKKTASGASLCGTPRCPKPSLSPSFQGYVVKAMPRHLNTSTSADSSHQATCPIPVCKPASAASHFLRTRKSQASFPKTKPNVPKSETQQNLDARVLKTEVLPSFPDRGLKEAVGKLASTGRGLQRMLPGSLESERSGSFVPGSKCRFAEAAQVSAWHDLRLSCEPEPIIGW